MTPFVCDLILNEYKESDEWVTKNHTNKSIFLSYPEIIHKNIEVRDEIDRLVECSIARIVGKVFHTYSGKYNSFNPRDNGYELISQIDSINFNDFSMEKLFVYISLNEGYNGGEFSFFDGEIKIKVPKGSGLVFPSNLTFPHKISPVTDGVNYCITTLIK